MFRYTAGKADWLANGLPIEGQRAEAPSAMGLAQADVPVCGLHQPAAEVRAQLAGTAWPACVVVNDSRVVLGWLRLDQPPRAGASARVEDQMDPAPRTFRCHADLCDIRDYLAERGLPAALVTTSGGRLVGLLPQSALADALREAQPAAVRAACE